MAGTALATFFDTSHWVKEMPQRSPAINEWGLTIVTVRVQSIES